MAIQELVEDVERSYLETQERMSDPAVYNDRREAADVGRDLKELVPELEERLETLEEELKLALVESDPADVKDVLVEIRQGVGGDEAALWAGDIYRMLARYAERRGSKTGGLS